MRFKKCHYRSQVDMKDLSEEAQGKIWICKVPDENKARDIERKYRITSKQYVEGGLQLRVISETPPELECMSVPATLEDAYIYFTNKYNKWCLLSKLKTLDFTDFCPIFWYNDCKDFDKNKSFFLQFSYRF